MVKVEPSQSAGTNFFAFALPAKSFTSAEIWVKDLPSAKRITGTNKPSSTATATPILTCSLYLILSPNQEELTAGCCFKATAQAFKTKSLKDILVGAYSLIFTLACIAWSISIDMVKKKCGAVNKDSDKRFAITLRI